MTLPTIIRCRLAVYIGLDNPLADEYMGRYGSLEIYAAQNGVPGRVSAVFWAEGQQDHEGPALRIPEGTLEVEGDMEEDRPVEVYTIVEDGAEYAFVRKHLPI